MQINAVAHAANATSNTTSTTTSTASGVDSLANEQVFLQMLVAQIQNQDPLNPTDSATFTTQLAQFSSLEQLIGIKKDVGTIVSAATAATTTSTTTT